MKFLNLDTGYTFDGIWKNTVSYSDWTIVDRIVPIKCNECSYASSVDDSTLKELMKNDKNQILYTDNEYAKAPGQSNDWYSEFNYNTTCKYAYRTEIPQTRGFIYWFPNEQSTGIIHTTPICVLTETSDPLNIKIEENNTFAFVSTSNVTTEIDGYTFIEPVFSYEYTTSPQLLDKYYAHVFHIACKNEIAGEYICKVNLDNENYFRVGVDLYGEYEPSYINLANMGVELPEMIQKAIYDVDPHEDAKDNITINRKFKELLINYWDIIANKGSYKSLVNSLKWFEWTNIEVKEIWKHLDAGKFIFDDRQLLSLFENKIQDTQNNFIKTAYIALYCSLYNELDVYDSEYNPVLSKAVFKWSQEDLRLKMSLLAQFFGIYFMPIHLALMHAVVEDKVFTNTIKNIHASENKRDDLFGEFGYINCNIKDNQDFVLTNVQSQVTKNTVYGIKEPGVTYNFGVEPFTNGGKIDNINIFASQYYVGPGVIIPIEFVLPQQSYGDFVKHTIVTFDNNRLDFYDKFYVANNSITINFNLLLKTAKNYSYIFTFILASGKTLTKRIDFRVVDPDGMWINIYKILSKDDTNGFTYEDFKDNVASKYLFKIQNSDKTTYYKQYLPYMLPNDERYNNYNGIKLNRTIVLKIKSKLSAKEKNKLKTLRKKLSNGYLEFERVNNDSIQYLIYVSKKFYEITPPELTNTDSLYEVIRNDLGFYPQFHKLQLLDGNTIEGYTINQYEAICCIPVSINKNKSIEFKYGHNISAFEWEFKNNSLLKDNVIKHPGSSQQPFIAKSRKSELDPGFYGITFKYKLSDDNSDKYNEINIASAFKMIHI